MFAYAILAGIERFLVEFIRTNEPVALGLTQQQWIAVAMFVVGASRACGGSRLTAGCVRSSPAKKTAGVAAAPASAGSGKKQGAGRI